jgi:hypothetical protein
MEILIVVAIWSVIVKRGVEDILHTARGGTPHRYTAARKQGSSGAWGRYWRALSDDTAADMLQRHRARRERRSGAPARPDKPRGAATRFFAGLFQDQRRAGSRRWDDAWTRLDEKRREKATRPRPGQDTVPGEVVPNAEDGPQDEAAPEPQVVPDEDGRTDLKFGDDPTDPTGTKTCPECRGTGLVDGEVCLSCRDRQEQRNQHWDEQDEPLVQPDQDQDIAPTAGPTTQEGPAMTATATTEVVGLDSAIRFCEDSARAYRAQIQAIEQTQAALAAGDVTGPAAELFAQTMEQSSQAAASMDAAAAELIRHKAVQEAYLANQGAGNRDFILAGQ